MDLGLFEQLTMKRRWHGFGSCEAVLQHVSEVKTEEDLRQLAFDIKAADCNLARFTSNGYGVFAVDCNAKDGIADRHVFMTRQAVDRFQPTDEEKLYTTFTILEA